MVFRQNSSFFPIAIYCIAALLFLPFLGNVHLFDWDEINFAESAREMLLTGNYRKVQIDFEPFWEKPPLFFWLQSLAMAVFGVNEYAARFPNAIFGIITIVSAYYIGKKHYNQHLGILWAMCYTGAILPHFYFKSGIIDPVFNYFIFMGLYFWTRTLYSISQNNIAQNVISKNTENHSTKSLKYAAISGIFIGLAILTKGPVGFLVPFLCYIVYAITQKFRGVFEWKTASVFLICVFIISLAWFGLDLLENGIWFLQTFIAYQIELFTKPVAGHDQPFYYHFVVLFFGCFPISIIALPYLFPKKYLPYNINGTIKWNFWRENNLEEVKNSPPDRGGAGGGVADSFSIYLEKMMLIMFWVVLILFSLATTKIVHYSSLTYHPLTFLAALRLWKLLYYKDSWTKTDSILLTVVGVLVATIFIILPFVGMNTAAITPMIKDDFAVANMKAIVSWNWYESLVGILYLFAILLAVRNFNKSNYQSAMNILLISTTVFMFIALYWVVPKIERYTQGSIIDFYKTLSGKNVYVHVLGFKSYAHYFYPQIQPNSDNLNEKQKRNSQWLMKGDIDKPVYFVTKVVSKTELAELRALPDVVELKELNGFVVFFRDKK